MPKMFCTWRATVCSLITSASAMSRLLRPAATSRKTSSSRAVRPWVSGACAPPRRARSGPAPSRAKTSRAASSSSAAVSSSSSARQASPTSTRTRAPSYGASSSARSARRRGGAVSAPWASPRARRTAPRAWAAAAGSAPPSEPAAISSSSAAARSASSFSPVAEQDLDERRQEGGALHRVGRLAERPPHGRRRRVLVSLGQPEQGEARLGLPAVRARAAVRLLGLAEPAEQSQELPLAVVSLSDPRAAHPRTGRPPSSPPRARPPTSRAAA